MGRLAFPAKKTIYTVHGFDSIRVANRKFLLLEKILKTRAKFIVAVSNYDKKMLATEGIKKNVRMIYNGINDCFEKNNISEFDTETSNYLEDIQKKHIILMTIARLSPPKDYNLFCKIADSFKDDERFHFIWIGNKKDKGHNTSNITMMGELVNAAVYLKYAHIFLLPSNYEGLPISILEALSYKIPVVASDVGGISEILNDKNGFAVQNNVSDFHTSIKKIINDEEIYKSYSEEARLMYDKEFTINDMYEKYMALYQNCKNQ